MKFIKGIIFSSSLTLISFMTAANNDGLSELALKRAGFSLEQTVQKVTKSFPGKITELKLDDHNHQSVFEVEVINEQQEIKHELKFSTADGRLLKTETTSLSSAGFSSLDDKDRLMLSQLDTSKFNLQASIKRIQKEYGSSIVELELENKKGITFYQVELSNDKELIIDVLTGETIMLTKKHQG